MSDRSYPSTPVGNSSLAVDYGNIKSEMEARQRLEKENFELKLQLYNLEDTLRRSSSRDGHFDGEIENMRQQLQEAYSELEQRKYEIDAQYLVDN